MLSQRSILRPVLLTAVLCIQTCMGQLMNDSQCSNSTSNTSRSMNYSQCLDEDPFESCPDPSLCVPTNSVDNVGLAFGLTIGAGLATTVGALLPFIPFIKRSNTLYLAGGLALAAGVMLYVSFTEIWTKARWNFCCKTPEHYDVVTTACFFGGILVTIVLDVIVTLLQKLDCGCRFPCCRGRCRTSGDLAEPRSNSRISATNTFHLRGINGVHKHDTSELINQVDSSHDSGMSATSVSSITEGSEVDIHSLQDDKQCTSVAVSDGVVLSENDDAVSHGPSIGTCTSVLPSNNENPYITSVEPSCDAIRTSVSNEPSECTNNYGNASVNELFSNSSLLRMNAVIIEDNGGAGGDSTVDLGSSHAPSQVSVSVDESKGRGSGLIRRNSYLEMVDQKHESFEPLGPEEFKEVTEGLGKDAKRLHKMGILTGLAIAIHNFPEGLATFVATLSSPSLGVALCIAIALHNIPEGVCVAMPVYYATGSRWKGFLWAFLSGISEPLGALLGWLVLKDSFGPLVYGILFGIIAGMMVFISLKELLPTARKFDKTKGILVNVFLVVGMVVMALSLLLFLY